MLANIIILSGQSIKNSDDFISTVLLVYKQSVLGYNYKCECINDHALIFGFLPSCRFAFKVQKIKCSSVSPNTVVPFRQ